MAEHTLHSRVKDTIAHTVQPSFVYQSLREVCYVNVYCDSVILCKTIIFVMS